MLAQKLDSPLWLLLVFCVAFSLASAPFSADHEETSSAPHIVDEVLDTAAVNYRLPLNTRPISYEVHLTTNVHAANFAFTGVVRIRLEVLLQSRTIVIHQRQLRIVNVALTNEQTSAPTAVGQWQYDAVTEQLTVPVAAAGADLAVGQRFVLTVTYEGEIRSDNFGVYRTSYVNDQNVTRWVMVCGDIFVDFRGT